MLNEFSCTYNIHLYIVRNLLLDDLDCFLLAKSRQPKRLSWLQKEELMRSFLKNSKLTGSAVFKLSDRLGSTPGQVRHFFAMQNKIPRNASIKAYTKLMQGKGSKVHVLNQNMRVHVYTL